MHCRVFRRPGRANERPSLTLKAKIEIAAVMHLVPDGIRMPPHAVHQLMAMAFRRGASYVLASPVTSDEQPLLQAVDWPRGALVPKPTVRELMESAFLYGAVYALQQRAAWNAPAADRMG